jgi:hypothetical protein
MSYEQFAADTKSVDAVIRNFEILGEAARHVPVEIQKSSPMLPWSKIRGMRNLLSHEYFGISKLTFACFRSFACHRQSKIHIQKKQTQPYKYTNFNINKLPHIDLLHYHPFEKLHKILFVTLLVYIRK